MSADEFLDSNILVYSVDARAPEKMERAHELVGRSLTNGSGCISYQVVQETLNVLTGKLGMPAESIRRLLDEILVPLWQVNRRRNSRRARGSRRGGVLRRSYRPPACWRGCKGNRPSPGFVLFTRGPGSGPPAGASTVRPIPQAARPRGCF